MGPGDRYGVPRRDVGPLAATAGATQARGLQTRADPSAVELNGVIDGTALRMRSEDTARADTDEATRVPVTSIGRDVPSAPRTDLDRLDEPISPELVLVDPELRARALEALPERDPYGFLPIIRTPAPRLEVVGADARPEHDEPDPAGAIDTPAAADQPSATPMPTGVLAQDPVALEPSIATLTVVYAAQSLVGVLAFIAKAVVLVIVLAVLAELIKL
jgi:hypothetical protein